MNALLTGAGRNRRETLRFTNQSGLSFVPHILCDRFHRARSGDWMELLRKQGFRPAVTDLKIAKRIWKIEKEANAGGNPWYPNMNAMRCCFYSKPDAPPPPRHPKQSVKSSIIKLDHSLAANPRKPTPAAASAKVAVRTRMPER